ncbi:hypothetical protein B0H66DRAFT_290690 [Apodospora peruviana]|uniref:Uncharacterized protein n=1 Tax=Apodospora peruviana TaxID=516989 RepID=A0AAE0I0K9_9PEZI|nr:hypothetical protein B0H66DRAFT_290690 [Apodospora peruviana]
MIGGDCIPPSKLVAVLRRRPCFLARILLWCLVGAHALSRPGIARLRMRCSKVRRLIARMTARMLVQRQKTMVLRPRQGRRACTARMARERNQATRGRV